MKIIEISKEDYLYLKNIINEMCKNANKHSFGDFSPEYLFLNDKLDRQGNEIRFKIKDENN